MLNGSGGGQGRGQLIGACLDGLGDGHDQAPVAIVMHVPGRSAFAGERLVLLPSGGVPKVV